MAVGAVGRDAPAGGGATGGGGDPRLMAVGVGRDATAGGGGDPRLMAVGVGRDATGGGGGGGGDPRLMAVGVGRDATTAGGGGGGGDPRLMAVGVGRDATAGGGGATGGGGVGDPRLIKSGGNGGSGGGNVGGSGGTPEKVVNSSEPPVNNNNNNNNHLNNKMTSIHQKQPPRRTPYINNNLGTTTTTTNHNNHNTACSLPTPSASGGNNNNNNNISSTTHNHNNTSTTSHNNNNTSSTTSHNHNHNTSSSTTTSHNHNNTSTTSHNHNHNSTTSQNHNHNSTTTSHNHNTSSSTTSHNHNHTSTTTHNPTPTTTISPNHHARSTTTTTPTSNNNNNNSNSNSSTHNPPDNERRNNPQPQPQQRLSKDERRTQDGVNGSVPSSSMRGGSGRVRQGSVKNNNNNSGGGGSKELRRTPRRRKHNTLTYKELANQGWALCVTWWGLAVQAAMWLCTLTTDVAVMSTRLSLHLLGLAWVQLQLYCCKGGQSLKHLANRIYSAFTSKEKEEKKLAGRDKKVTGVLDYNITLPITGDEAMKRLLACKGKDPYSILGLTHQCTDDDIKKYYKRQAFLVHPDKNKQPGAEEAFKILAHAFEIIGEPERRKEYDLRLAEEVKLEGAWGELASLLTRLQEKLDEAANTIRCTNCNKRHRRVKLTRPIYAARDCTECKVHHAAREGDIWAESTMLGLRWRYYACMEGAVYDISDWAACQSDNLKHLQANTHSVQYRIVSGKKNHPAKNTNSTPEFPSDPDLEEFFNNLCKEKFGKNYSSGGGGGGGGGSGGGSQSGGGGGGQMPDMRKRRGKKKK
ncbi:hypothetical protein Pcinc_040589 [Petrolisthes cinctipes]|uniref:J domain-containing protein n=1 Tax=Petrolisthes cinctipes TaxID=88211 RepID=A0AAE1EKN1_PETCI|nr:hypothetical protein Pcinc_040589 [Petrolisthes cinctipes]